MQTLPALVAAAALAAATAFVTVQYLPPTPPLQAPAADPATALLQQKVDALEQQLAELRAAPAAAAMPASSQRVPVPQITDEQIEQALARYLAAHGDKLPVAAAAAGNGEVDLTATLAELRGKSDYWSHTELYKRLHAAGKMDALLEELEQSAQQNPKDPQAQMDLGNACLAYLQMDQSKWQLSTTADESFDRVLAIDENHWQARFTKAVSYTFWPDFLGKKKEAIAHFERLADQQATRPQRPEYAQTYLFLGNLLEQRGEADRAREIWQRGLRLHPDDTGLRGKLGQ